MSGINNSTPIEHRSHFGTLFAAERADLSTGVKVSGVPEDAASAMSDVAEFAAFHAMQVWPELTAFPGYDCIYFEVTP